MSDPNKITLPLVGVEIELSAGRAVIAKAVPEHEVRVLRAVHGAGKVKRTELSAEMEPEGEFYANMHLEYARLRAVYRPREGADPVQIAFPDGPEALLAYEFTAGAEGESAVPHNMSVNHGLAERQAKAKARKQAAKANDKAADREKAREAEQRAREDAEAEAAADAAARAASKEPKGGKAS